MKERIKKYVDGLFADIYETKQLLELKEEISANLLEKVNDLVAGGNSEEIAFNKAVSSLGDMNELIGNLKKASQEKGNSDQYRTFPLDRKQVIGYVTASAIFLFGVMAGGIVYLKQRELITASLYFVPFLLVAVPLFSYFGLVQETRHHYGMKHQRALSYSLAGEVLLLGIVARRHDVFSAPGTINGCSSLAAVCDYFGHCFLLYLGLTEKNAAEGSVSEKQWIEYYKQSADLGVQGHLAPCGFLPLLLFSWWPSPGAGSTPGSFWWWPPVWKFLWELSLQRKKSKELFDLIW